MSENKIIVSDEAVDELYNKIKKDAVSGGYNLNPDTVFTKSLVKGLIVNEKRYGYQACPCRLADGKKEKDLDIICPCDYRDSDVNEFGACYCGLYVSGEIASGKKKLAPIPERRPAEEERTSNQTEQPKPAAVPVVPLPVWRCKVCGYLCARQEPPEICPICKVKKDRFERFL